MDTASIFGLLRKKLIRAVPKNIRWWIREYHSSRRISLSPDRAILTEIIIPAFAKTSESGLGSDILWIGTRRYTKGYYALLEKQGARCWTLDIDPRAKRWGRPGRHIVGDVLALEALFPDRRFDAVFLNGVLGWGVDTPDDQQAASRAMAAVCKSEGWLLVGWNTNRISDPLETAILAPWFAPVPLPNFGTRRVVEGCTHVYDILRRRPRQSTVPDSECG